MKMQHFSFLFFALIVSVQPVQAVDGPESLSYLDMSKGDLAEVIAEISLWDENKNSLLWQLQRYIKAGNDSARREDVLEVLAYAEDVVEKKSKQLSADIVHHINDLLDKIAHAIEHG